jgi:hypothetical protein
VNSNPYTLPAVIALAMIAVLLGAYTLTTRTPGPRHRAGRSGFADPADTADPDGDRSVRDLRDDANETDDAPWPEQPPGRPPMPPPDPPSAQTGELPALLAAGTVTPAEVADRLASKYLTAEVPQ